MRFLWKVSFRNWLYVYMLHAITFYSFPVYEFTNFSRKCGISHICVCKRIIIIYRRRERKSSWKPFFLYTSSLQACMCIGMRYSNRVTYLIFDVIMAELTQNALKRLLKIHQYLSSRSVMLLIYTKKRIK